MLYENEGGTQPPFCDGRRANALPCASQRGALGGADTTLPIPIPFYGPRCSPGPQGHGASDWLCQTLLFPLFSPPQSLETVSYRRCCHVYCPCRLSHRPRPTGSVAYCDGVGSASRTETWSQLTRLLVSLLLRPQAMLLVPDTFEYSPCSATWSPRLPAAESPDRQSWLMANACLGAWMTSVTKSTWH